MPDAAWAAAVAVWDVEASMWYIASSVSDSEASAHGAQVLRGLLRLPCGMTHPLRGILKPLCMTHRRHVSCCILCGSCCSLKA